MLTIGEMCAGYGGLAMGVQMVLDAKVAWVSEVAPGPSMILAHRYPGVANVGDLTTAPWEAIRPADILTCGFPCQPASAAGKRKGTDDERWIWPDIVAAIGRMEPRPRLLLCENVTGLLSVGGGSAMAAVIHGLASLGYVGRYRVLRASDTGAPHRRERVFVVAADTGSGGLEGFSAYARQAAEDAGGNVAERAGGHGPARSGDLVPDAELAGLERPPGEGLAGGRGASGELAGSSGCPDWGSYATSVQTWERVLGRPAPWPVEPGRNGKWRLSRRFTEWMMGLPDGWVTDVHGLSRREQLSALGNGVVPQQAALALQLLLPGEVCAPSRLVLQRTTSYN